ARLRRQALVDRTGREPQIEAVALALRDLAQASEQDPLDLAAEGGLVVRDAGQRHADAWRDDRLVSAAFRRQRDAGRRGDDDEAAAGVERVVDRVESAIDERIIERADGQEGSARQLV